MGMNEAASKQMNQIVGGKRMRQTMFEVELKLDRRIKHRYGTYYPEAHRASIFPHMIWLVNTCNGAEPEKFDKALIDTCTHELLHHLIENLSDNPTSPEDYVKEEAFIKSATQGSDLIIAYSWLRILLGRRELPYHNPRLLRIKNKKKE